MVESLRRDVQAFGLVASVLGMMGKGFLMDQRKPQPFRPTLDRLEDVVLMSGNVARVNHVVAHGGVDLKNTPVSTDLRTTFLKATPIDGRKAWSVRGLSIDPLSRTLHGDVGLLYKYRPVTSYLVPILGTKTTKVTVTFTTNLDAPRVADIKIGSGRDFFAFNSNVKRTLSLAIVNLIKRDQALIASTID
jgi:hypothetical protein